MKTLARRLAGQLTGALVGAAMLTGSALAGPYSSMVVFGDSLSDTGNVLALTQAGGLPPFPSFPGAEGRFSNGPVWVETLAAGLGLPADAGPTRQIFDGANVIPLGVPGGSNYAFGGARTGLGGSAGLTTGILGQLLAWNGGLFGANLTRAADGNALYVIAAGGNDMRDYRSGVANALTPDQAAENLVNYMLLLAQAGARNFLVTNLPDLGRTPEAIDQGTTKGSTAATQAFNASLAARLAGADALFLALTGIDLDVDLVDFYGLGQAVFDDAQNNNGATFGITNISSPCIHPVAPGFYFVPGSTEQNCGASAFSDDLHPTAAMHRLLGAAALQAVPVPGSFALVLPALAIVFLVRRRRAGA